MLNSFVLNLNVYSIILQENFNEMQRLFVVSLEMDEKKKITKMSTI